MLKFQIAFVAILVYCIAFVSCERTQQVLAPVTEDITVVDTTAHKSWMSVALPAPGPQDQATSAAETGAVHGLGTRAVYFNELGVPANEAGTAYSIGTVIVKEIMDDTNTFVAKIATMTKTDDPMYATHNGWMYAKYARASETEAYTAVGGDVTERGSAGCHGCHIGAANDSVFVSLTPTESEIEGPEIPPTNGADTTQ